MLLCTFPFTLSLLCFGFFLYSLGCILILSMIIMSSFYIFTEFERLMLFQFSSQWFICKYNIIKRTKINSKLSYITTNITLLSKKGHCMTSAKSDHLQKHSFNPQIKRLYLFSGFFNIHFLENIPQQQVIAVTSDEPLISQQINKQQHTIMQKDEVLQMLINQELRKLIRPVLYRLEKVQGELNQFKQILGGNSSTNYEKKYIKNRYALPQDSEPQISYTKYQNQYVETQMSDDEYLNMTDEQLLDYHFKHLKIDQSASLQWKEWFETMLVVFKEKKTQKTRSYTSQSKLIIIKFIHFGGQNGNSKIDMIKAAGISNSSYKRWRLPNFGIRKNYD